MTWYGKLFAKAPNDNCAKLHYISTFSWITNNCLLKSSWWGAEWSISFLGSSVVLIALWIFPNSILFSHWFYWCDAVLGMGGQRLLSHEDWFINQQITHTWIMIVQRIGFNGNGLRALSYFLCFWCQIRVFLISKMKKRVQETWQALGRSWIQHRKRCTRCSLRLLNFLPSFGALATGCNTCQTDQLDGKDIG